MTASECFHVSLLIRAINSVQMRSKVWIASASYQRTHADSIGATSSVRLGVNFSSMRCSAIARVIGLPSRAR